MTTETQMGAGRELDLLIGTEVFGLVQCTNTRAHPSDNPYSNRYCLAEPESPTDGGEVQMFSTSYEGMGLVLERMRALGWTYDVDATDGVPLVTWGRPGPHRPIRADAPTLPHAVALAALEAVRATKEAL